MKPAGLEMVRRPSADLEVVPEASHEGSTPKAAQEPGPNDIVDFDADRSGVEYALPLGCFLHGLKVTHRDAAVQRSVAHGLFLALFLGVACWAHPGSAIFEVQAGVLQGLEAARFEAVTDDAAFWSWARTALYPQVYLSAGSNAANHSDLQAHVVGKYSRLLTPVRFRQLRSQQGECAFSADSHALSRPCWPGYAASLSDPTLRSANSLAGLGSTVAYFAEGLSPLADNREVGSSYGSGGHVVDLDWQPASALRTLEAMAAGRWTDEWTRSVSVELNVYNPTYDLATAFRFQANRALGGRVEAHVEASTCHLNPYAGSGGILRYIVELLWLISYLVHVVVTLLKCRKGVCAYLREAWSWIELLCLLSYASIIVGWIVYLTSDRSTFQVQHPAEFKDLYSVCSRYDATTTFAAVSVICAFVQAVKYVCPSPPSSMLWQVLAHAAAALLPFTAIVLLCVLAFSHSGAWVFGAQVYDFHTWPQTIGFLFRSMIAGMTAKRNGQKLQVWVSMLDVKPALAYVWTVTWTLMSELVIFNLFVAILVASFAFVGRRSSASRQLAEAFGPSSWADFLRSRFSRCYSDPEVCERLQALSQEERAWRAQLAHVDHNALQALVLRCVARGEQDLQLKDAARLFPRQDEAESYQQAAAWMTGLSDAIGVKLQFSPPRPSTAREVRALMEKVARLEEEALGLCEQLRPAQRPGSA